MKREYKLALAALVVTAGSILLLRAGIGHVLTRRIDRAFATFSQGGYQPATATGRVGQPLPPLAPAPGSCSRGINFLVIPRLPTGLTLDRSTGVLHGTPRVAAPRTTYTVIATFEQRSARSEVQLTILGAPEGD